MTKLNGFKPEWGDYYIATVSLRESNPKHKVIINIDYVDDANEIGYTPLSYEERKMYISTNIPYFELVEKLNMDLV